MPHDPTNRSGDPASDITVEAAAGTLRGVQQNGLRVFRGIPFAAPPVGALRWRPPQPAASWTGVRDATSFGFDCPQRTTLPLSSRAPAQSEDCLTLNVWAPAVASAQKMPVMVWVFGGSFVFGSAAEERADGATFARDGIVYITLNYRVGVFGFLAHPALSAESPAGSSGNYGLLDQIAGLHWVRDNAAAFGGDPERITVFGVSAGAASIAALITSPLAEGLFQQAILQSPGSFRPLATLAQAEAAGTALGDDIATLRALSSEEVLDRQKLLVPPTRGLTAPRVLRPIQDGHVVPMDERTAYRSGRCMRIKLIVGSNADEGSNAVASWPIRSVAQFHRLLDADFGAHATAAKSLYPVSDDTDVPGALAAAFGDSQFTYAAWGLADAMARLLPDVWRYVFTRQRPGTSGCPRHSEEVSYVFDRPELPPRDAVSHRFDTTDIAIATAMHRAWVSFATTGSPCGPDEAFWPRYDSATRPLLEFGDAPAIRHDWRDAQMALLDEVLNQASRPTPGRR